MAEAEKQTDTGLAGQLSRVWRLGVLGAVLMALTGVVMWLACPGEP